MGFYGLGEGQVVDPSLGRAGGHVALPVLLPPAGSTGGICDAYNLERKGGVLCLVPPPYLYSSRTGRVSAEWSSRGFAAETQ